MKKDLIGVILDMAQPNTSIDSRYVHYKQQGTSN